MEVVGVDPKIFKDQDWGDSSSSFLKSGGWDVDHQRKCIHPKTEGRLPALKDQF